MLQVQFTDSLPQEDPQILIVEHTELPAAFVQQVIAIFVEGHQPQAAEIHSTQFTLDPLAHLSGGIVGIGYGEYFARQRAASGESDVLCGG